MHHILIVENSVVIVRFATFNTTEYAIIYYYCNRFINDWENLARKTISSF